MKSITTTPDTDALVEIMIGATRGCPTVTGPNIYSRSFRYRYDDLEYLIGGPAHKTANYRDHDHLKSAHQCFEEYLSLFPEIRPLFREVQDD
ncbi:hypothetical protein [uncultured Ruegeria sp.]|uniref:hypothetical protein n=1 Tax=uncultured Ruegeria sp. TaxID=259304 RepID=UPI00261E08C4|nr:hypothetical protein [uncultured Ruegeria sp.]